MNPYLKALRATWFPALILVAVLATFIVRWADNHNQTPVGTSTPGAPDPAIKHEPRQDTPVQSGTVKTYPAETKRKLDLPADVRDDNSRQVLDATRVPADDHPQTVTTVIDTRTGASSTYVARDPLPWLAFDYTGDAGVYYGWRNGAKALRLEARQGFITIKAVHVGIIASLDQPLAGAPTPPDTFIGAGAWAHW
jgi:hypothetical protein